MAGARLRIWHWPVLTVTASKGLIIASIDWLTGKLVRLFNPRTQSWPAHFCLSGGEIIPLTPTGRVTEQLLRLNLPERVETRERLADVGLYP